MADFLFRVKNSPLGPLVVKFYHIEPYSDLAFLRARTKEFWFATQPGSGQVWGEALYQGPVAANTILPAFIAQLHARCAHCTGLRIERGHSGRSNQ